jgi:hypothetical protein
LRALEALLLLEPSAADEPQPDRSRMLAARDHLLDNLHSPPTTDALSRIVGTNTLQLKRDFQATAQVATAIKPATTPTASASPPCAKAPGPRLGRGRRAVASLAAESWTRLLEVWSANDERRLRTHRRSASHRSSSSNENALHQRARAFVTAATSKRC